MHQALYRKYRPSTFDDVSGQEHITSILRYEAETNSVSHAYLFAGSRGTGKTTCAKILAKVVNCLSPVNGNPCNHCENCKAIDSGSATDVIEMDAATNTGVDYIRDLRDSVVYTPAMLKKRVYIIDEAHMLSDSAFNALLKTIEEPPEHVIYIFATTEPHKIPATIISRCQKFEFRRISVTDLSNRLKYIAKEENIEITDDGAFLISKYAQGGMRDSISLMELCAGTHKVIDSALVNEILGTNSYDKMCDIVNSIAEKNYSKIFKIINDVVMSSKDLLVFISDLTSFYRDMTVQKSCQSKDFLDLSDLDYKMLEDVTSKFSMATLIYHTKLLDEAYLSMMRNPGGKRLTTEITLLKMCDSKLSTNLDSILSRLNTLEDKITMLQKGVLPSDINPVDDSAKKDEKNVSDDKTNDIQPNTDNDIETKDNTEEPLDVWHDVVTKVGESDKAIESFLKNCTCTYFPAERKYTISTENQLMATMLSSEKNKKVIFDSMICLDVDIKSLAQLEIVLNNKAKVIKDDLAEFDGKE